MPKKRDSFSLFLFLYVCLKFCQYLLFEKYSNFSFFLLFYGIINCLFFYVRTMKHFVKILGKSFTLLVLLANELFLPFSFSNDLSSDLLELPQDVSLIDEVLENQENSIL